MSNDLFSTRVTIYVNMSAVGGNMSISVSKAFSYLYACEIVCNLSTEKSYKVFIRGSLNASACTVQAQ